MWPFRKEPCGTPRYFYIAEDHQQNICVQYDRMNAFNNGHDINECRATILAFWQAVEGQVPGLREMFGKKEIEFQNGRAVVKVTPFSQE